MHPIATTIEIYPIISNFLLYFCFSGISSATKNLINTNDIPKDNFYISFDTKKRNVIPLVRVNNTTKRIVEISDEAKDIYDSLNNYQGYKYAYIETINNL